MFAQTGKSAVQLIMPNPPPAEMWHNPRQFRSRKTRGRVLAATKLHEDFLALMTLDETILSIQAGDTSFDLPSPFGTHRPAYEVEDVDGQVRLCDVIMNSVLDNSAFSSGIGRGLCDVVSKAAKEQDLVWDPVYEDDLRADPRNTNIQHVLGARGTHVPATDRIAILEYLKESQGASLVEAARLASAQVSGVSVLMSLVFENHVQFDFDRPLVPETMMRRTDFSYESVTEELSL